MQIVQMSEVLRTARTIVQAIVQGLCVGSALVFCAHVALGLVGGGRSAPGADCVLRRGPKLFCVTVRGQNNSSSVSKEFCVTVYF